MTSRRLKMTTGTIESLNLDAIKMENPYLRLGTDVSTLEKSIETVGLIAPLIVNEENVLLAGARRWQALKNLGHKDVPIIRVKKSNLEQELISIDENLVRKSLTSPEVEKHLLRAKEIYCEMAGNDESFKNELLKKRHERLAQDSAGDTENSKAGTQEELSLKELATEEFAEEVSHKSGLSRNQVLKAMEREEKACPELKEAREIGNINVSQANEIIRLNPDEQKEIIPHIAGKTVGELRKLVKEARSVGVKRALETNIEQPHAREYGEILKSFKKAYKVCEALEIEGIEIKGALKSDIERHWAGLIEKMESLLGEKHSQEFSPEYLDQPHQ